MLGKVNMERFANKSDIDIQSMLTNKDSKATKQAVKILREYCAEKELPTEFENINKVELDNLLKHVYANARKNGLDGHKSVKPKAQEKQNCSLLLNRFPVNTDLITEWEEAVYKVERQGNQLKASNFQPQRNQSHNYAKPSEFL